MKAEIYFITGVPGSGKSTVMELLKQQLDSHYQIHDFDERGVPDNVDSSWQESETEHWIKQGLENQQKGITTIICGFAIPPHTKNIYPVKFILLDLDSQALQNRLSERYTSEVNVIELKRMTGLTPEESIAENINSIKWLYGLCADYGAAIINTSTLTPDQVVLKIKKSLN